MRRKRRAANLVFLEFGFIATRYNRYDDAAFFYDAIRSGERVAADRIEHKIDIVHDLFEFLFRVIDCNIGAELFQQILIDSRGRSDDAGTAPLCDLNRETSNASRATMNQHRFSALDVSNVDQRLPRR